MATKLLGDSKGPISDLGDLHFGGPVELGTMGNEDRTYALGLALAYRRDFERLAMDWATCSTCGGLWLDAEHKRLCKCAAGRDAEGRFYGAFPVPDADFLDPDLETLAEFAGHAWAGHNGWDTAQRIEMVKAGTGLRQNHLAFAEGQGPQP
jgi:hypothetical protein